LPPIAAASGQRSGRHRTYFRRAETLYFRRISDPLLGCAAKTLRLSKDLHLAFEYRVAPGTPDEILARATPIWCAP
jgi:hypothetical protein